MKPSRFALPLMLVSLAALADDTDFKVPAGEVTRDQWNAIALIQQARTAAVSPAAASAYFPASEVLQIASELQLIRERFPEVAAIDDFYAGPAIYTEAIAGLAEATRSALLPIVKQRADIVEPLTHFVSGGVDVSDLVSLMPELRQLSSIVPLTSIEAKYTGGSRLPFTADFLLLKTAYPVSFAALGEALKPMTAFEYIEADGRVGDGNRIRRRAASDGGVDYEFTLSSGDCPAGCTVFHNFLFRLDPVAKTVVKTGENTAHP